MRNSANRREVAHWAQQYLSGVLSLDQFVELVPVDSEDEEVAELLDLIIHEPKEGGVFGVRAEEYARHMGRIRALVEILASRSGSESAG